QRRISLSIASGKGMAGTTRLELATSAVTGQRSNQLNYVPALGTNSAPGSRHPVQHRSRLFPVQGRTGWAIWMLNGDQIGVKSPPAGASGLSSATHTRTPQHSGGLTLLYRPVAQVPLVRSWPNREHKLLHDVLQPQFIRQIVKVEFHGAHHPTFSISALSPMYVASDVPFPNILILLTLPISSRGLVIRITHGFRTEMALERLFG